MNHNRPNIFVKYLKTMPNSPTFEVIAKIKSHCAKFGLKKNDISCEIRNNKLDRL